MMLCTKVICQRWLPIAVVICGLFWVYCSEASVPAGAAVGDKDKRQRYSFSLAIDGKIGPYADTAFGNYYNGRNSLKEPLQDTTSFAAASLANELYQQGLQAEAHFEHSHAVQLYTSSFERYPSKRAAKQISNLYMMAETFEAAKYWLLSILNNFDAKDVSALINLGVAEHRTGNFQRAIELYFMAAECNVSEAVFVTINFYLGISHQFLGDVVKASHYYFRAVETDPLFFKARLNLAALHHKYGRVSDAVENYERSIQSIVDLFTKSHDLSELVKRIDLVEVPRCSAFRIYHPSYFAMMPSLITEVPEYSMTIINLVIAYQQNGQVEQAICELELILRAFEVTLQRFCQPHLNQSPTATMTRIMCDSVIQSMLTATSHRLKIFRAIAYWKDMEVNVAHLLHRSIASMQKLPPLDPFILPFDSLLLPINEADRYTLACLYSTTRYRTSTVALSALPHIQKGQKLRIGFLSFDFNDHPTAHMVEGIFSVLREKKAATNTDSLELIIYNYGKDDKSSYRNRLVQLADRFVDLTLATHQEAIETIRSDGIHVLLDLQVHTLGNRLEIVQGRPAAVQINYLVYPGTSGTQALDNIIVDAIVVPPEHSVHYAEKLVMLPKSYQISFYDRHMLPRQGSYDSNELDVPRNNDGKMVVFCNFNKIDKLDLDSFQVWMNIMQEVPRSVLWLLEPAFHKIDHPLQHLNGTEQNALSKEHFRRMAAFWGVHPRRIQFVERLDKARHIFRHNKIDLFLDSFVYGAHSTATDAMKGGLPVLTILGDSFPSRVPASVISSFDDHSMPQPHSPMQLAVLLVRESSKDFEEYAVRYGQRRQARAVLKAKMTHVSRNRVGVFDTEARTRSFVHGLQALAELRLLVKNSPSNTNNDSSLDLTTVLHVAARSHHVIVG